MPQEIIIYDDGDQFDCNNTGRNLSTSHNSHKSFGITIPEDQLVTRLLPAQSYLNELAPTSARTITSYLNRMAKILNHSSYELCPWHNLTKDYVNYIVRKLLDENKSPDTVSSYLTAIKGVIHSAYTMNLISSDDYTQIKSIKKPKGSRLKKQGVLLTSDHIARLIAASSADTNANKSKRDIAIISILRGCGLRRSEVVSLTVNQINFNDNSLTVIGKRNKERMIWFGDQVRIPLKNWLACRSMDVGGSSNNSDRFLFVSVHSKGNIQEKSSLTSQAIYNMLKQRQSESGVPEFAPHDIRRTYITMLLDQGHAIEDVQALAGHSSSETTKIYDLNKVRNLKKIGSAISF